MDTWVTQDGRRLRPKDIELDHLLNIVNDCNYRVAVMTVKAAKALGGLENRNINQKTKDAFLTVRAGDVFPLWKELARSVNRRFYDEFGVRLGEIRKIVYDAWTNPGVYVPIKYERAIRFYLCTETRKSTTRPLRLVQYVMAMDVDSDEKFRAMCWNLRVDQPECWRHISVTSEVPILRMVKRIPPSRLNSALNFQTPRTTPLGYDWETMGFDIPFSTR